MVFVGDDHANARDYSPSRTLLHDCADVDRLVERWSVEVGVEECDRGTNDSRGRRIVSNRSIAQQIRSLKIKNIASV